MGNGHRSLGAQALLDELAAMATSHVILAYTEIALHLDRSGKRAAPASRLLHLDMMDVNSSLNSYDASGVVA